jgi:hypothetical protein
VKEEVTSGGDEKESRKEFNTEARSAENAEGAEKWKKEHSQEWMCHKAEESGWINF